MRADGLESRKPKLNRPSTFSLMVLFCFFFSGIAGLIYEILWQRMIDKVVGSAPFAVATVLSVFMGGLALGSWLAGKHIDRISSRGGLLVALWQSGNSDRRLRLCCFPLFISLDEACLCFGLQSVFLCISGFIAFLLSWDVRCFYWCPPH